MPKVIDILVEFRNEMRIRALNRSEKDIESLKACDHVRKRLSDYGVDIKVKTRIIVLQSKIILLSNTLFFRINKENLLGR